MKKILALSAALMIAATPAAAFDCSGTITAGGTAQLVNLSSVSRGFFMMNGSANLMCISFDGTAAIAGTNCAAGSYALNPGTATVAGGFFMSPSGYSPSVVSVITATTGDRYSCTRF